MSDKLHSRQDSDDPAPLSVIGRAAAYVAVACAVTVFAPTLPAPLPIRALLAAGLSPTAEEALPSGLAAPRKMDLPHGPLCT